MKKSMLKKYASLIVRTGANVQKGQKVEVNASVDQAMLVRYVVYEAYRAGAALVKVNWTDELLTRYDYRYATEKTLGKVLPWQEEKARQQVEDLPVMIHIVSDDPDGLKGVNVKKMSHVRQARLKVLKKYREQMENHYQWVIAAAASEKWAKKIFPDMRTSQAVEALWNLIFRCVYLDETNDPQAAWKAHNQNFLERCAWLNGLHLKELVYKSANGTDFRVGLIPTALFMGGGEYTTRGVYYNPNMPTEEIFTSPMRTQASGKVVATKPLSYQGQLIDGFSITFENGKAVSCEAQVGEELLKQMLSMDENAAYLGEVALVPKESPVNQCNTLFYETLFDENACCHLAVGAGFTNVLQGFETMSLEETQAAGINDSIIHVDFMIGSDDLQIEGICQDGSKVAIFENGTWAR